MMAQKKSLHELLKQDQEPFHLKRYISDKRSQLNNSSPATALQVKKRSNFSKNACYYWFRSSSDVGKSPFIDFQSPAISPCKSPNGAVFLHVPSQTAAVLIEAAMRIQKRQQPKNNTQIKNVRLSLFGPFLKILKHQSKKKKRAIEGNKMKVSRNYEPHHERPFRFSGRRTPEFCSPVAPPMRNVKQEHNAAGKILGNTVHGVESEKEQRSPVSILDPFFEDDGHEGADEDKYDLGCSYANIHIARQKLLKRLQRFEKLAALDPMELERRLPVGSDDECQRESVQSEDEEQLSLFRKQGLDTSTLPHNPRKMSTDMNWLVSDQIVPVKNKIVYSSQLGRICNSLNSWKEVEFSVIDMMVELDFKSEFDQWKNYPEQVEEMAAEVELDIFGVLVEELSDELLFVIEQHQELNWIPM